MPLVSPFDGSPLRLAAFHNGGSVDAVTASHSAGGHSSLFSRTGAHLEH